MHVCTYADLRRAVQNATNQSGNLLHVQYSVLKCMLSAHRVCVLWNSSSLLNNYTWSIAVVNEHISSNVSPSKYLISFRYLPLILFVSCLSKRSVQFSM